MRAVVALGVLAAVTFGTSDVLAAKNPTRASIDCRKVLGRTFRQLARLGFREVARCERRASKANAARDCTLLQPSGTAYRRWAHRTGAFVAARCVTEDPVRTTFPLRDLPSGVTTGDPVYAIDDVTAAIEGSAAELQQGAVVGGRAVIGPASCRMAIGDARSRVALGVMNAAVQCQRRLDVREHGFGMLDQRCALPSADEVVRDAAGIIAGACGGTSGAEVGSCDPLPECVIDAAAATGLALARATYGQCGNGALDSGEDCDDANTVVDECTQCRSAACGNGRVEGSEECDDGNLIDHDACTDCRNPICGDGIVDVGPEECDDANDASGDGCAGCRFESVACTERGIVATLVFEYDPSSLNIAGVTLRMGYDAETLSIPGSLVAPTVSERVTNHTGEGGFFVAADRDFLPSEEAPDGIDDTVQTSQAFAQGRLIPSGPFASVRFDCPSGTPIDSSRFNCRTGDATDPFINLIAPETIARETRCSIRVETPPAP